MKHRGNRRLGRDPHLNHLERPIYDLFVGLVHVRDRGMPKGSKPLTEKGFERKDRDND